MNELSKEAGNVLYPVLGGGHRSVHSYQNLRTVHFNDISTKKVVKKKNQSYLNYGCLPKNAFILPQWE